MLDKFDVFKHRLLVYPCASVCVQGQVQELGRACLASFPINHVVMKEKNKGLFKGKRKHGTFPEKKPEVCEEKNSDQSSETAFGLSFSRFSKIQLHRTFLTK